MPTGDDAKTWTTRIPPEVYQDPQFSRKYLIERELGTGGAGVVVCARHLELDERVAIKFLLPGAENSRAIARFRREARAANRVKDEHVVRIIDVATTDGGVPYVVMEYLEGVDLERMLLESPSRQLPVRDAIEFVLQACEALAECHRIGIVHRDLKPSNLFCSYGADGLPLIKLLDFGISKLSPAFGDGVMTGKHGIIGSPRYMSPEQFASPADVDLRTDIWALGVILYELVTGSAPFAGSTVIKLWENVKGGAVASVLSLRRDAPIAIEAIIQRCLEKDPEKRYQNVAELAKALLPLGSERSRNSVARIVRVVESPGSTTASLSLPRPLPDFDITPGPVSKVERARPRVLIALGVLGTAAAAVFFAVPRPNAARDEAAQAKASAAPMPQRPLPSIRSLALAGPVPRAPLAPAVSAAAAAVSAVPARTSARAATIPRVAHSRASATAAQAWPTASEPTPSPLLSATTAHSVPAVAATPSEALPPPAPAATEVTKAAGSAGVPASKSKWLVDIVEQRKPNGGRP
jgi:serine/threonine protein kinase